MLEDMENNRLWGQKTLAPYPHIAVQVLFKNGQIELVTLESAKAFVVQFYGDKGSEEPIIQWLLQYSQGKRAPSLPFSWKKRTSFMHDTLEAMQRIPFGECKSYAEIAEEIGNPRACRAVGNVCRSNPFQLFIPCHRVIQKSGKLGGYASGLDIKKQLLDFEEIRSK